LSSAVRRTEGQPLGLRTGLLVCVAGLVGLLLAWPASADVKSVRLLCEAVYLPARTVWAREVELEHNEKALTAVRVDGVSVHAFSVDGTLVLTSMDNERIQIDTAAQTWHSDFRGLAQSQGRCERIR
jgi:hypothetical protein